MDTAGALRSLGGEVTGPKASGMRNRHFLAWFATSQVSRSPPGRGNVVHNIVLLSSGPPLGAERSLPAERGIPRIPWGTVTWISSSLPGCRASRVTNSTVWASSW